ncbi:MAG TPA: hypothetical protein PLW02_09620, partial [Verrucomicrobiota bacterium]|nr:hypothetical protein [Verrucomicrobiota bacterium]
MFKFLKKLFTEKVEASQRKEPTDSIVTSDKSKEQIISYKKQQPTVETNKDYISISVNSIISGLSDKLKKEIIKTPNPSDTLNIPVEKILPQIKTGAFKITFGEMKKLTPTGIFSTNCAFDNEIIYLSLKEIIPKLDMSFFKIQPKKEQIIPDEIADIFGGQKTDNKIKPVSVKRTEIIEEPAISQQKPTPSEKQEQLEPNKEPIQKPLSATTSEELKEIISLKLNLIIPYLPPEIVKQTQTLKLSESSINIPIKELEPLIKSGKVIFNWNKIFSWLSPLPQSAPSNPDVNVEIPLKIIAPLFF